MLKLLKTLQSEPGLLPGLSMRRRVLLWIGLLSALLAVAGYLGYSKLRQQISNDAYVAADREMQSLQDLLELHRQLYLAQVRASIELLKRDTLELGPPHIDGEVSVGGEMVPNLKFGDFSIANNTALVDSVQSLMGGTAAVFVRKGDTFIRVATNVLDEHGQRALNTRIDSSGAAIHPLLAGGIYAGVIDILGSPYIGEDDPIIDAQGRVVGVWFVGFKIENLERLRDRIGTRHILENGFVALFDNRHRLVAASSNAPQGILDTVCQQADLSPRRDITIVTDDWSIRKETFVPWDCAIVSATYFPDLGWRAINSVWMIFSVVAIIAFGALLAQGVALIRAQQLKAEAEKARTSAEEASKTKSAFLANMSHELRTPLNAIIGYSEMLIEEASEDGAGEMVPDLRKIQGSGKHLLSLINDILDLSKIEAGKMTVYLEEFSVPQMIREIAATIQPLLEKNGNTLEIDCPEEVGCIYSDLTKTRQILFNLLSNASKFTNHGRVRLTCKRDGGMIHFAVRDTGLGITPEAQQRIFKEFIQADNSTTRKFGGTGLGLAISKRFCEMMGGTIRLESQVGVGTTFYVDLPVRSTCEADPALEVLRKPAEAASLPAMGEVSAPASGTVLVIDDDPQAQDLLRRIFEKEGYHVQLVNNGREALTLAENIRPMLITLDIMMPGLDGWAVLTTLKNNPKTRDIPVIVVTLVDNRPMALALGAADYITKPFDREKILQLLHKHGLSDPPRILIVEDDINSYELLARSLEQDGFKVAYAPNGRVALEMFADVKPTLIILDLMMPEMNGFDFLTELRRRDQGAKVPVVVLSAKELTAQERDLLRETVQKTILKGEISTRDLIEEVRRYLPETAAKK